MRAAPNGNAARAIETRAALVDYPAAYFLRVPIDAPVEVWIRQLAVGDRQVHVGPVGAALEEGAVREHLVLRAAVLPDQPAKIAQPPPAPELPERLLAEEQRERGIPGRRRRGQRRHHRNGLVPDRL